MVNVRARARKHTRRDPSSTVVNDNSERCFATAGSLGRVSSN